MSYFGVKGTLALVTQVSKGVKPTQNFIESFMESRKKVVQFEALKFKVLDNVSPKVILNHLSQKLSTEYIIQTI